MIDSTPPVPKRKEWRRVNISIIPSRKRTGVRSNTASETIVRKYERKESDNWSNTVSEMIEKYRTSHRKDHK